MSRDEFTTMEQYNTLQAQRTKIEGYGSDVTITVCCPFCCEPEFQTYKMLEVRQVTIKEHVCRLCKRGLVTVFHDDTSGTTIELIQTQGPDHDLPWMPPIRRKPA